MTIAETPISKRVSGVEAAFGEHLCHQLLGGASRHRDQHPDGFDRQGTVEHVVHQRRGSPGSQVHRNSCPCDNGEPEERQHEVGDEQGSAAAPPHQPSESGTARCVGAQGPGRGGRRSAGVMSQTVVAARMGTSASVVSKLD